MTKEEIARLIEEEGDHERFEYRGLRCYIVRNPKFGYLLGYVETPCEIDWNTVEGIDVHGGVSFIGQIGETYYPIEAREEKIHVVGFFCGRLFDYVPFQSELCSLDEQTYKTMRYVENECRKLADQLLKIAEERNKDNGR